MSKWSDVLDIGTTLKKERERMMLTQKEVADKLCFSRQTISNWELGKSYPDLETIVLLSDLYSVSLDILLKEDANILHEVKKKNTVKLRIFVAILLVIISGFLLNKYTYSFAKQAHIINFPTESIVAKISFFGKGNTLYFFNSKGEMIFSKKIDRNKTFYIGEEEIFGLNENIIEN